MTRGTAEAPVGRHPGVLGQERNWVLGLERCPVRPEECGDWVNNVPINNSYRTRIPSSGNGLVSLAIPTIRRPSVPVSLSPAGSNVQVITSVMVRLPLGVDTVT